MNESEQVLVVEASAVRDLFNGKVWLPHTGSLNLLMDRLGSAWFIARGKCEDDPEFKQLIPYIVLTHKGKVYRYVRGETGSEGRLIAKASIGLGGHVNQVDRHDSEYPARAIRRAAERELTEEVGLNFRSHVRSSRLAGLISHDEDPVGAVHLGVCFVVDLYDDSIEPKETAIANGQWATPAELWVTPNWERWSAICVQNLFAAEGVTS